MDAVKAMQASPRVPNPENLHQAKVMPERLTKKTEVEGDGSKIQEQVRRFQEFKFREFKITKGILEKFGFSDICKDCEAASSGTDAKRHADDCRQRLEQLIRDDEVLRVRLDMRDVRLNRDSECEKHKRPEELKVDEQMGEAEAAGGQVAEDLLENEDHIVDAETFEVETSDANREDADKEHDEGKGKMDSGEENRTRITSSDDFSCWRLKRNSWTSFLKGASPSSLLKTTPPQGYTWSRRGDEATSRPQHPGPNTYGQNFGQVCRRHLSRKENTSGQEKNRSSARRED